MQLFSNLSTSPRKDEDLHFTTLHMIMVVGKLMCLFSCIQYCYVAVVVLHVTINLHEIINLFPTFAYSDIG